MCLIDFLLTFTLPSIHPLVSHSKELKSITDESQWINQRKKGKKDFILSWPDQVPRWSKAKVSKLLMKTCFWQDDPESSNNLFNTWLDCGEKISDMGLTNFRWNCTFLTSNLLLRSQNLDNRKNANLNCLNLLKANKKDILWLGSWKKHKSRPRRVKENHGERDDIESSRYIRN